jgi:hypothetical protein
MSNDRITDQDVERIANAVGRKILFYGVILFLLAFLLPIACTYVFRSSGA